MYIINIPLLFQVEKTNAQGLTLEEAKGINKSLLALSNVISSLSEGTVSCRVIDNTIHQYCCYDNSIVTIAIALLLWRPIDICVPSSVDYYYCCCCYSDHIYLIVTLN